MQFYIRIIKGKLLQQLCIPSLWWVCPTYAAGPPSDEEFVVRTGGAQDLPIVEALEDGNGL